MKRFTETTKWQDAWFRKLSPRLKCLWTFLCDGCDAAGVIDPDWDLLSFQIGEGVSPDDLAAFGTGRIHTLPNGKIWICRFMEFQYGTLSRDCKAHTPIFKAIAFHHLESLLKGYARGIHTLKEQDKEKETDKKEEVLGEIPADAIIAAHKKLESIPGFPKEWEQFRVHRKKKRDPMTPHAEDLILRDLAERPHLAIDAIQEAIKAGWKCIRWDWLENRAPKIFTGHAAQSGGQGSGRMAVLRKAVEKYGAAEFKRWVGERFDGNFPVGGDDYLKSPESVVVDFLHAKGEKA